MGIIIDTCIWIDVERGSLSPADVAGITREEPVFITPVSLAELNFGVEMARDEGIKIKRQAALDRLRKKPILLINEETGIIFGKMAAQLRKQGRGGEFRIQDLWIASLGIQNNFPILTHNTKDFSDIPGISLLHI